MKDARLLTNSYIHFVACQDNPWHIRQDVAVPALQAIWDAVYSDLEPHVVEAKEAVYYLVSPSYFIYIYVLLNHIRRLSSESPTHGAPCWARQECWL
jgi:hypothetical protein